MDFASLPPEMNSAWMYSGPGSAPMLAAAAAWDDLAVDLHSTAAAYGSVISELAGSWSGASSTTVTSAAAPYVAWLISTAGQAEQAVNQARAAAAADYAAFAMAVPRLLSRPTAPCWRRWWPPTSRVKTPRRSRSPNPRTTICASPTPSPNSPAFLPDHF